MASSCSTEIWDPGLVDRLPCICTTSFDFDMFEECKETVWNNPCFISTQLVMFDTDFMRFTDLCLHYADIWTMFKKKLISLSKMRYELDQCEQRLIEHSYSSLFLEIIILKSHAHEETLTLPILLLYYKFHPSSQKYKKFFLDQDLTKKLAQKSETDLYNIYNEYIDHLMTRKSMVTEEDLCIREIDPYYEFQLKLCYGEKLIKQAKYEQYNKFMVKNIDFAKSFIKELKTKEDYETMTKSCIFFLNVLNIDISYHQTGGLLNNEKLTSVLSDLLRMLP